MCNVRIEMALTPAASCFPMLNHSHTWASNLIFASIGDAPYVQSVIGTLSPLQSALEVGTGRGRWVRVSIWMWVGQWGVKGDMFGFSPHADSTWFSLANLMTPPDCRVSGFGIWVFVLWLTGLYLCSSCHGVLSCPQQRDKVGRYLFPDIVYLFVFLV